MRNAGIEDARNSRRLAPRDDDPTRADGPTPTAPAPGRIQPAALGQAPAAPSVLRRNDNPRFKLNNAAVVRTPLTVRSQTGGSTPLRDFAPVSTSLTCRADIPAATAPSRSALGRVAQGIRSMVGVPTPLQWLRQTMRTLRCQALGVAPPTQANPLPRMRLDLSATDGGERVTRFWLQQGVGIEGDGQRGALIGHAEQLGRDRPFHVSLGLSFVVLAAAQNEADAATVPVSLALLQGDDALERILSAETPNTADATDSPVVRIAVAMLRHAALSNQFDRLATALAPALQPLQLAPLRRFLEANAVVSAEAGRVEPNSASDMAQRVRGAARTELQTGAAGLTAQQTVESFYWDNHLRDEGPKSDLAALKQHFSNALRELGHEPSTRGVLSAAYRYGLAGADRHLLIGEAQRLTSLRDSDAMDALVSKLNRALRAKLANPPTMHGLVERSIAQLVALGAWAPDSKHTLTLEDMIRGREFPREPDAALRTRIEAACAEISRDLEGGLGAAVSPAVGSQALAAKVQGELSRVRLGVEDLERLAKELHVALDDTDQHLLDESAACIDAHTCMPGEHTPEAVGSMVGDFLEGVYFGNHIKLSHASAGTLSMSGLSMNVTSVLGIGPLADAAVAVVPRLQKSSEWGKEQVFRAGAATHGVEIFLGHELQSRHSNGAGVVAGYPSEGSLARISAAVDLRAKGRDTSRSEGVMLRIDRTIEEDGVDEHGTRVFRQSDPSVRQTAGGVARLLFQRASAARSEADRQQALDDLILQFHDQGLSITLLKQHAERQRRDLTLGGGLSYEISLGDGVAGLRLGANLSGGVEYGHHTHTSQRDTTGSYKVNNLRTGWYTRLALNGGAATNAYVGPVGLPPTPVLRGTVTQNEGGATVRVRMPTRQGRVVPEKTFSDTETADPRLFKEIVLAEKQKWVDLFAFEFRNEPDPNARGEQALDDYFHTIESVRSGNHVYYARERLHPDVGQRLDELASLESLAPLSMSMLRAEIARQRSVLMSDDRSWGAASLIAYEKNSVQQGAALSVAGVQGRHVSAVEGEREIVFQTPGWANLRARERAHRPGSLSDIDRAAAAPGQ